MKNVGRPADAPGTVTPTTQAAQRPVLKADAAGFKKGRVIADDLIALKAGESVIIKVMGVPKQMGGGSERWGKNAPPVVLPVELHPTMKAVLLVLQTVLESRFELLGEDAIGHWYLIEAGSTVPGKAYRSFDVTELDPPEHA